MVVLRCTKPPNFAVSDVFKARMQRTDYGVHVCVCVCASRFMGVASVCVVMAVESNTRRDSFDEVSKLLYFWWEKLLCVGERRGGGISRIHYEG